MVAPCKDVVQPSCIHTFLNVELSRSFYTLLPSDLPTVKDFLLKQTQLKCLMLQLVIDSRNAINTVKVLKCYNGIVT